MYPSTQNLCAATLRVQVNRDPRSETSAVCQNAIEPQRNIGHPMEYRPM